VGFVEASNGIVSYALVLFAVRLLPTNPLIGNVRLPFNDYEVSFGEERGNDLRAFLGGTSLIGEVFNVAPFFFPQKNLLH